MTSPTGRVRGFTLLEVLITLAIIALFSAVFLLRFDDGRAEELLSESASELKAAALLAKKRSHAFREDQFIHFDGQNYVVTNVASSSLNSGESVIGSDDDLIYTIPSDVSVEIQPFGVNRWIPLREHTWHFRSSGLNEPLEIRLSIGQNYTVLAFHSLTGLAEEETLLE